MHDQSGPAQEEAPEGVPLRDGERLQLVEGREAPSGLGLAEPREGGELRPGHRVGAGLVHDEPRAGAHRASSVAGSTRSTTSTATRPVARPDRDRPDVAVGRLQVDHLDGRIVRAEPDLTERDLTERAAS